ncbi:MAG: TrmH family RNA methyltransferase [Bacillota bacterium]|jgi:TrmH family RNA methyltransferase
MENITSKNNQYIKQARSLQEKKYRDKENLYLIEGLRLSEEALSVQEDLSYGFISHKFLMQPRAARLIDDLQNLQVPLFLLEDNLFAYCSDTVQPQGILLVAKKANNSRERLLAGSKSFWFLADDLQDPGNLGTILRTAWAAGADGAVILAGGVDQYNPKVVRSSMGAVFNLPIYIADDNGDALSLIREAGLEILVASSEGNIIYNEADLKKPLVWVLGSEAHGASEMWKKEANSIVSLPMYGNAESLNVAVAGGILFYETLRQRIDS